MCTAEQTAILKTMIPYLEGRTVVQVKRDAILDKVSESWEAGLGAGKNDIGQIITVFAVTLAVAAFFFRSSPVSFGTPLIPVWRGGRNSRSQTTYSNLEH